MIFHKALLRELTTAALPTFFVLLGIMLTTQLVKLLGQAASGAITSVGVLAQTMLLQDQRVTFIEGSVRRSIGSALVEVGVSKESSGGTAARAQLLARLGSLNVSGEAVIANDFHLQGGPATTQREARLGVDAPIRLGRTVIPAHADVHYLSRPDGSSQLDAAARLATTIDRFNLAAQVRYTQQHLAKGPAPPPDVVADLIGTGRIGPVRVGTL